MQVERLSRGPHLVLTGPDPLEGDLAVPRGDGVRLTVAVDAGRSERRRLEVEMEIVVAQRVRPAAAEAQQERGRERGMRAATSLGGVSSSASASQPPQGLMTLGIASDFATPIS
jgi:hypothetical protein